MTKNSFQRNEKPNLTRIEGIPAKGTDSMFRPRISYKRSKKSQNDNLHAKTSPYVKN